MKKKGIYLSESKEKRILQTSWRQTQINLKILLNYINPSRLSVFQLFMFQMTQRFKKIQLDDGLV